jgi:hypothetical protein
VTIEDPTVDQHDERGHRDDVVLLGEIPPPVRIDLDNRDAVPLKSIDDWFHLHAGGTAGRREFEHLN